MDKPLEERTRKALRKLLYSRRDGASALEISASSLDVLISSRQIKVVRKGRRVFIPASEIERMAALELPAIWPGKRNGKTTRWFAPPKPPTSPAGRQDEAVGA
jgi:hypothetical protein